MKHIFIINSISGKGQGLRLVDTIEEVCKEKGLDYEIKVTKHPNHAKEYTEQYFEKDDVTIYSVGGDGTLFEVLNGLNENVPLGIIPAGSGNDFYRLIGNDYEAHRRQNIIDTIEANTTYIDYGLTDQTRFMNCTSFGIDADINYDASYMIRNTFLNKGAAYILGILKHIICLKAKYVRLTIDGEKREGKYFIVACMNGRYYGNGVQACPTAELQDGYFDLCLVNEVPKLKAYPFIAKYMKGKHIGDPAFEVVRCKHVIVESDEEMSCQSDGENYKAKRLELKMKEKGLLLKVPAYLNIIQ